MDIGFGRAKATQRHVIAALAGGTGAGKSCSALELGTGLVSDPERELFMIDTEFGRGAHYADAYKFQYGQLSPPFRPERYQDAIDASIAAGSKCTIVDSLSHMWEGDQGLLDWHSEIALKMARGNEENVDRFNFPAWRMPKQALQGFVLYLQRCPIHLILCLRAKAKSKMVKVVKDGRTVTDIVDAGLQPIIDTATPYEATFLAMLSQEEPGVPHWTHKALASYLQPVFASGGKQLSREHGHKLAVWCGGTPPPQTEHAAESSREPDGPQATRAAGDKVGEARDRFMKRLESTNDLGALAELQQKLGQYEKGLGGHYQECAKALQAKQKAMMAGKDTHEVFAELEDDEWKNATGRVEDERQGDLV